jgi:hypothetical protein
MHSAERSLVKLIWELLPMEGFEWYWWGARWSGFAHDNAAENCPPKDELAFSEISDQVLNPSFSPQLRSLRIPHAKRPTIMRTQFSNAISKEKTNVRSPNPEQWQQFGSLA